MAPDNLDFLDLVGESIVVRGLDGRIQAWNTASEALYGLSRGAVIGNHIDEVLLSRYPTAIADIEAQTLASGKWHGEIRRTTGAGRELSIKAQWSVRRAPDGTPKGIVETGRDVTAAKLSEEALRYSEYRYRNMFQAMAAAFWELDFSGANSLVRGVVKSGVTDLRRYFAENPAFVREMMRATRAVDVNDQTVALFGRGARQELLRDVEAFWPEESTQVYADSYAAAAEGKPNYAAECRFRRIDGTHFHGLFTVAYPPREMGRGTTMVGVIDVTARKDSEEALRISGRRYQNLFQARAVSFWEVDFTGVRDIVRELRNAGVTDYRRFLSSNPDQVRRLLQATRVIDVNDRTVALFGRGSKEELLSSTEPMWPEESWDAYIEAFVSSLERRASFSIETRLRRLDGSTFDAQFTAWHSPDNPLAGLAGVLDITERKKAHADLQRSNRRYRHLFHHVPIPLWQVDSRGINSLIRQLKDEGVIDIKKHIDEHPDVVDRAMQVIVVEEVNRSSVELFAADDPSKMRGPVTNF